MKVDLKSISRFALLLSATALSACALNAPNFATPVVMYDGPHLENSQVARVMAMDFAVKPSDATQRVWTSRVVAVDGKKVEGDINSPRIIHLLPGKHHFSMTCSTPYWSETRTQDVDLNIPAGYVVFPWADVRATILKGGVPVSGSCSPFLSSQEPTTGVVHVM